MTWEQQRQQILATIKAKRKEMGQIITKASTEKRTVNDDEEAQIQVLETELEALEKNLKRIDGFIQAEKHANANATPVAGQTAEQAHATAEGDPNPSQANSVTVTDNLEKGIGFAQFAKAKALSSMMAKQGSYVNASDIAKSQGMHPIVVTALEKGVVLNTTNSSQLVAQDTITSEFIELLRERTIVDKLAPLMRKTPFNVKIAGQATGSMASWVGEGKAKPVTNPTFNDVEIKHHKLAGIAVRTDELMMLSGFSVDAMLRDDLLEGCQALIDQTFIDKQDQTSERPVGILFDVTPITSTGIGVDEYKADLKSLKQSFIKNNLSLSGAYYLMSETRASDLAELTDALGNPTYRGMQNDVNMKTLHGLPVLESEKIADVIILVKPSELYLADEGSVDVSYSDQATIDMGTDKVNLWQDNMFAIRAERHITWQKRRPIAAAYIQYT